MPLCFCFWKDGVCLKKKDRNSFVFVLCLSLCISLFGTSPMVVSATEIVPTEMDTEESVTTQEDNEEDTSYFEVPLSGYIDIDERIAPYNTSNSALVYSRSIPASYNASIDNLQYVSPVKNQGNYNSCWAFALASAAESNMLKKGYPLSDYSEYQFAYFFYHHVDDPLGNTKGDSTSIYNGSNYLDLGGTNLWPMFAAAGWIGLSDETTAPYGTASPTSSLPSDLAYNDQVHMQQCRAISMSDTDDVKKAIMDYGSAVCAVRFSANYFNYSTSSLNYDNSSSKSCNHAINIIGWDDSYSRDNFPTNHKPTGDGAWLVKNSWGTSSAPFFWVSYEDVAMSNQDAFAYSFDKSDNYDNIYQYDGAYGSYYCSITNGYSVVNRFTSTAGAVEQIKAVSIALYDDNINYSVQIYRNSAENNPKSGEPLLETPVVGTTTYAGYYTIDLNQNITVNYGDTFSVVFTVSDMDDGSVLIFTDSTYESPTGVRFVSSTNANQSYICDSNNNVCDMKELSSYDLCPRIKAFTDTISTIENRTQDMYRLYNPNSGEHFYTAVVGERDYLVKVGWIYEGVAWKAPVSGDPVYRLYNPNAGDHHYTLSVAERDYLIKVGWNYEGISWYSGGPIPLYRAYNPNAIAGSHHYTTNKNEIDYIVKVGWKYEGIAWYGK